MKITNRSSLWLPFNIEKMVNALLKSVPPEDLVGLQEILLVDEITTDSPGRKEGIYKMRVRHDPARIELAVKTIYRGVPRLVFFLPFVPKFLFAMVLYHEIGHHYQQYFTHRIKKKASENFAEKYSNRMLIKRFCGWLRFFYVLRHPIRWLRKKLRGRAETALAADNNRLDEDLHKRSAAHH